LPLLANAIGRREPHAHELLGRLARALDRRVPGPAGTREGLVLSPEVTPDPNRRAHRGDAPARTVQQHEQLRDVGHGAHHRASAGITRAVASSLG
jgi:hypothetical protein